MKTGDKQNLAFIGEAPVSPVSSLIPHHFGGSCNSHTPGMYCVSGSDTGDGAP